MKDSGSPIFSTLARAQAEGLAADAVERRLWERHGTTCAMLALDSSGMTRITRSHGIVHFLTCYARMRELTEKIVEQHGCLGWRGFADNLFAEFPDADGAFAAARDIHRELREAQLMLKDDEPYTVCLGIGYGRVLENGVQGVMGDEMNIVAKLAEDLASGSETLLTEAAFRALTLPPANAQQRQDTISGLAVTFYRVPER